MLRLKTLLFITLLLVSLQSNAQKKSRKEIKKAAKTFMGYEDYNRALKELLKLHRNTPYDLELNKNIGICYLNVNDDRSKAIPYLEYVLSKSDYKYSVLLYAGLAYSYHYEFDKAISYFNKYRLQATPEEIELVDHYIENCENAKVLIKKPVNVSFENLGKDINSKAPDYYPFVSADEGSLYFTSRRSSTLGKNETEDGYFTSDIFVSKVEKGQWIHAKNIGPVINTEEDEECVYLTPSGKTIVIYMYHEADEDELYVSTLIEGKKQTMPQPEVLDGPVNKKSSFDLEACITEDGNTLIIASDRPGGLGGSDLYTVKKLPNGKWGEPLNLGPAINTKWDENFPMLDEKNNVLYFSSHGHTGMGGYDIFKSKFNPETRTYGPPTNIGYPINTPEDNMQISLAKNKRDAYVSAYRKEGFGDLDIYKVTFNDVDKMLSVIKGVVSIADTTKKDIEATITIIDKKSNEEIDSKEVNPQTGKYIFAVEPGKYILKVNASGYPETAQEISVYDKSNFIFEIVKNIQLEKKPETLPRK
ncbi:MAG: hypothetical protein M3R27_08350 [Bacteroidota bacterium]|nr:hypothetical protein [Bacteroidota bacterium]